MQKIKADYIHSREITEDLLDVYGHVNHAKYLELFEECRWGMIKSEGYGMDEINRLRIGPIILEAKIKYKKELKLSDKIEIHTWTDPIKKKIGKIYQKMFLPGDLLASEVELLYGLMHLDKRTLQPPPESWKKALKIDS